MPIHLLSLAPPLLLLVAAAIGFAQPGRIGRCALAFIEVLALLPIGCVLGAAALLITAVIYFTALPRIESYFQQ